MKQITFFIVALFLVPLALNAQLLYKVSGNGLEKNSYILGTHHSMPYQFLQEVNGFDKAFNSCTQFYGEIKMDEVAAAEMVHKLQMEIMIPKDTLFKDLFSEEDYKFLDGELKKYIDPSIGVEQVSMLNPAALSMQLSSVIISRIEPTYNATQVMDAQLQKKAVEKGIKVGEFETVDEQLILLFGESLKKQADDLIHTLKNRKMDRELKTMLDLYKKQDSEALYMFADRLMREDSKSIEDYERSLERLLNKRNRNWVEKLIVSMKQEPTFVAVGAGHLHGKEGLINLLRAKGYKVVAVK